MRSRRAGAIRRRICAGLRGLVAGVAAALALFAVAVPGPARAALPIPSLVGQWGPVTDSPLVAIQGVLLHTGQVLTMDGWQAPNPAELFDPTTGGFSPLTNSL